MNKELAKKARQAKREKRMVELEPCRDLLLKAMDTARELLDSEDDALRLKATHSVSQLTTSYVKLYEVLEVQTEIEELWEAVNGEDG